jgi:hypothetical protein
MKKQKDDYKLKKKNLFFRGIKRIFTIRITQK